MIKYCLLLGIIGWGCLTAGSFKSTTGTCSELVTTNLKMVEGFAGDKLSAAMANLPASSKTGNGEQYTRESFIQEKIAASKQMLADLRCIRTTPESYDIISSAIAMQEFVIAVYETDYLHLAKMYDSGMPADQILLFDKAIRNLHSSMFALHYENLLRGEKLFAARSNIKVDEPIAQAFVK